MKTGICDKLIIDVPIFAFSHCRDVVVAVSKAGGIGVRGVFKRLLTEYAYAAERIQVINKDLFD